jgi:hypothetical protein
MTGTFLSDLLLTDTESTMDSEIIVTERIG